MAMKKMNVKANIVSLHPSQKQKFPEIPILCSGVFAIFGAPNNFVKNSNF